MGEPLHTVYSPTYGDPFGGSGTAQTGFGFTGEVTDASGLVYLRARYYLPTLGVFPSLDPVEEGNRYGYVGGNVVNRVDPSGEYWWDKDGTPPVFHLLKDLSGVVSGLIALSVSESPGFNEEWHAEYAINLGWSKGDQPHPGVDLLYAHRDSKSPVEIWEIKPNNHAGRAAGRRQLRDYLATYIPGGKRAKLYNTNSRPHPIHDFQYDWNNREWARGTSYPDVVFVALTDQPSKLTLTGQVCREVWLAGQSEPGLIVYWKHDLCDSDLQDLPRLVPADRIIPSEWTKNIKTDDRGKPGTIVPFPRETQSQQEAAFSLVDMAILLGLSCAIGGLLLTPFPDDVLIPFLLRNLVTIGG